MGSKRRKTATAASDEVIAAKRVDPKVLFAWLLIPATLAGTIGGSIALRDYIAVSPETHDKDIAVVSSQLKTHFVDYQLTAEKARTNCQDIKQGTIDGLRDQITNITIKRAGITNAEVLAGLLKLEASINKLMAKAQKDKAAC